MIATDCFRSWPLTNIALADRPARMKAKGTIRDSLVWSESRRYFYNRLRRRLAEEDALKRLSAANSSLSREERMQIVNESIATDGLDFNNDAAVAIALEKGKGAIASRVKDTRAVAIGDSIASMAEEDHAGVVEGIKMLLSDKLNSDDLAVSWPARRALRVFRTLTFSFCYRLCLVCSLLRFLVSYRRSLFLCLSWSPQHYSIISLFYVPFLISWNTADQYSSRSSYSRARDGLCITTACSLQQGLVLKCGPSSRISAVLVILD